jgi:hypothetical protein
MLAVPPVESESLEQKESLKGESACIDRKHEFRVPFFDCVPAARHCLLHAFGMTTRPAEPTAA